ncbi:MAG: 6-carboxytetrahydropterin synthase [Acidobacteria bacterium]|nr:6-carboxytetrahydropterin synthase [Acidobacteriota bacterium]
MTFQVQFAKENQKFSAAHFTLFSDGEVERLHGHNYQVSVTLHGSGLTDGLLFPFHEVKPQLKAFCDAWDERILLPTQSKWVRVESKDKQVEIHLKTDKHNKFYSFPLEDVVLLPIDNVSCENLVAHFAQLLAEWVLHQALPVSRITVSISESLGQTVSYQVDL